ncbi:MAG: hypothetical protein V7640_2810 [Betaproteobacteria bacterium]|jgi:hypothetical protein
MIKPNTTPRGAGDNLHANRPGYMAMGTAIDLELLKPVTPKNRERSRPTSH